MQPPIPSSESFLFLEPHYDYVHNKTNSQLLLLAQWLRNGFGIASRGPFRPCFAVRPLRYPHIEVINSTYALTSIPADIRMIRVQVAK